MKEKHNASNTIKALPMRIEQAEITQNKSNGFKRTRVKDYNHSYKQAQEIKVTMP